jgi:glyoxylase-like metal-dependent hydrolase (beta-lactamase superfamily II)
MTADDTYEIYAIKYGYHARRSPENFLGGDPHDVPNPIDFFVWVITAAHGTYVVDTGFDEAMGRKRQREITKPVAEGFRALGIAPDSVKNVIISHLHYDHAGNHDLFPNARYHIQDTEMAYVTGRCMCHNHLRMPFAHSMMERTRSRPASPCTRSAATRKDCNAFA